MSTTQESAKENQIRILESIKDTQLDLRIVLMEKKFSIGKLSGLCPGAVILFDCPSSQPARLTVNGTTFAEGKVIQVEENYGLEIEELK